MASTSQIKLLQRQRDIAGVTAFREAGYTGKGWNVLQLESSTSDHATECVADILDIAPGMTVYRATSTIITKSSGVTATCKYNGITYTLEEFIKQYNIKFVTKSVGGKPVDIVKSAYFQDLIDRYNIILVTPAGNKGKSGLCVAFPVDVSIVVGAVGLSDSNTISVLNYSGRGNEVDFVYFMGYRTGTSYAAPRLLGVMGLLSEKYGDMTKDEMYSLLKSLCREIDSSGTYNDGYGIPILKV